MDGDEEVSVCLSRCVSVVKQSVQSGGEGDGGGEQTCVRGVPTQASSQVAASYCGTWPRKRFQKHAEKGGVCALPGSLEYARSALEATRGRLCLRDIHQQLGHSGLAIYTGTCDEDGGVLVLVFCKHSGWNAGEVATSELAKLLLYYHSIQKVSPEHRRGLALVVDARGTSLSILNSLVTTFHSVQEADANAIAVVHVLTDRAAQQLLFRSSIFQPSVDTKINVVTSVETMQRFIQARNLPTQLGGSLQHSHHKWLAFRKDVETLVARCVQASTQLVRVMSDLVSLPHLPSTAADTDRAIDRHEDIQRRVKEEPVLAGIRQEADTMLNKLRDDLAAVEHCRDCRESLACAEKFTCSIDGSLTEVCKLAEQRLNQLHRCKRQRNLQKHAAEVLSWLKTEGAALLGKYTSDLTGLLAACDTATVQEQFADECNNAEKQLSRGAELLSEAGELSRSAGNLTDVDNIREVTAELKTHMNTFSEQLEGAKTTIAKSVPCQNLLDKCYKWALETMRYLSVGSGQVPHSADEVSELLSGLDLYLEEQPAVTEQALGELVDMARDAGKPQLLDQCQAVCTRCREASDLLRTRRSMLIHRLEKLQIEDSHRRMHQTPLEELRRHSHALGGYEVPEPYPNDFVSPLGNYTEYVSRRRSYAGRPSAPLYSPAAAAFRAGVRDLSLTEYEEQLFSEGLITEDMSDRIVTSLPKGLSDCTLRNSRESLRGSHESLNGSAENLCELTTPPTSPEKIPSSPITPPTTSSLPNSHNFPPSLTATHRHSYRGHVPTHTRSISVGSSPMDFMDSGIMSSSRPMESGVSASSRRCPRPLSMLTGITGSSESLPSMPEEEEGEEDGEEEETEETDEKTERPATSSPPLHRRGSSPDTWSPASSKLRSNLKSYHSVTDLRLTDDEVKRRKTLALIMSEMIQTEEDYVRSLAFIVENYVPELHREDMPNALNGKGNIIFSNLEKISSFHALHFLHELKCTRDNPLLVARCFLRHFEEFYLYALYNKNKPKCDELMADGGARFFKKKQQELQDRLDLSSYLLKPVQRLGKYVLLLTQVIKECPVHDPEYPHLQRAIEQIRFLLRHGNDLLAMDALRDSDVNLQEQGQLLRQEEFIVWQGRKKSIRRVFLFEELLVFSKPRRSSAGHDIYTYKSSIKLSDVGLTENIGGRGMRFEIWFRKLRATSQTFTLQAANMNVKECWVRDISKLLWRQAIKNRELRRQEMDRMGCGNKPGLDIKPSKDNIQDRSVHTRRLQVPRFRNSIAVSSMDVITDCSKRPHSIISISSESSSSSSHSSGGGGLYVGLTGAGALMNSTTNSVESGFVSDLSSGSSSQCEDAYTQTTLRRPGQPSQPALSLASTFNDPPGSTPSHMLGTDV